MKKLPAAGFLSDNGLLFEINRKVLHPRGLALEVIEDDDGTLTMSQELQDHRDSGGIHFGEESIERGKEKLERFDATSTVVWIKSPAPRSFDYVAFWDECAWVAATLGPYVVAQGMMCEDAILNLGRTLLTYRAYEEREGSPPWSLLREGELVPPDDFAERAMTAEVIEESPTFVRGTSYKGTLRDVG